MDISDTGGEATDNTMTMLSHSDMNEADDTDNVQMQRLNYEYTMTIIFFINYEKFLYQLFIFLYVSFIYFFLSLYCS